jgi:hypothetical protein
VSFASSKVPQIKRSVKIIPFLTTLHFDFFWNFAIMKSHQKGGMPIEDETQQLRRFSTTPVLSGTGISRDREDSEGKTQ